MKKLRTAEEFTRARLVLLRAIGERQEAEHLDTVRLNLLSVIEVLQWATGDDEVFFAKLLRDLEQTFPGDVPGVPRYWLSKNETAICCGNCGRISHNPNDVEKRFCGACHRFHDEPEYVPTCP